MHLDGNDDCDDDGDDSDDVDVDGDNAGDVDDDEAGWWSKWGWCKAAAHPCEPDWPSTIQGATSQEGSCNQSDRDHDDDEEENEDYGDGGHGDYDGRDDEEKKGTDLCIVEILSSDPSCKNVINSCRLY